MNSAGDEFFTGASLTRDQDRGTRRRNLRDALTDLSNRLALAVNLGGSFQSHYRILEQDVFAQKSRALARTAYRCAYHLGLKGLRKEVESTSPHAFYSQFDAGDCGQNNHRECWIGFASVRKDLQPLSIWHPLICDNYLEVISRESASRLFYSCSLRDCMLILSQIGRKDSAHARFIVDDQNSSH